MIFDWILVIGLRNILNLFNIYFQIFVGFQDTFLVSLYNSYTKLKCDFLTVDEKDEVSISTVAESIARAFNFQGEIRYDSTQADGQFKKTASNAKLRSYIPHFQFTPFEQALNDTVQWFKQNYDTARK
jgi:GDP-L-fucose synthase